MGSFRLHKGAATITFEMNPSPLRATRVTADSRGRCEAQLLIWLSFGPKKSFLRISSILILNLHGIISARPKGIKVSSFDAFARALANVYPNVQRLRLALTFSLEASRSPGVTPKRSYKVRPLMWRLTMTTGCRFPVLHTHTHVWYIPVHTTPQKAALWRSLPRIFQKKNSLDSKVDFCT